MSKSTAQTGISGQRNLRNIFAVEDVEKLIGLAQTAAGKLTIYVVALLALLPYREWWEAGFTVTAAMAYAYLPKWRNQIIFLATWLLTFLYLSLDETSVPDYLQQVLVQEQIHYASAVVIICIAQLVLLFWAWGMLEMARRYQTLFFARRPVLTLLGIGAVLGAFASLDLVHGFVRVMLWAILLVYVRFIWFLAYAMVDQRSREGSPVLFQLGVLRPFWGFSHLPYGKGAAFLRKTASKTPEDLAITQIKGIKLLLWANVLYVIKEVLTWFFEDRLHIPRVRVALDAYLQNRPYAIHMGWLSLIWSTAKYALKLAAIAHLFIGIARLAGFRLPRGMWRPLESRTLMEYFNRFSYYFKELLVDFFFIPTFFRMFKRHPRVRMFFATFMAAGVGNAIWHFFRDINEIIDVGLQGALVSYSSYAFYCVILAIGLGISQVRASSGIKPSSTFLGRLYCFLFVWSFVIVLHVFSDESRNHGLQERLSFLMSLFGVN